MDPNTGKLYESIAFKAAGVNNPVELIGEPSAIRQIADDVRVQRKKRRKVQKASRRANR